MTYSLFVSCWSKRVCSQTGYRYESGMVEYDLPGAGVGLGVDTVVVGFGDTVVYRHDQLLG